MTLTQFLIAVPVALAVGTAIGCITTPRQHRGHMRRSDWIGFIVGTMLVNPAMWCVYAVCSVWLLTVLYTPQHTTREWRECLMFMRFNEHVACN